MVARRVEQNKKCMRVVEGADPYGFERLPIRYRRRILSGFVVVGAGDLDSP